MSLPPHLLIAPVIFIACIATSFLLAKTNLLPHLNEQQSRYAQIDGLRGLAAVAVICAHSWRISFTGAQNDSLFKADLFSNQMLGAIGVQIFFCITGFLFFDKLLKNEKIDWQQFFMARFKRLAPLYIFVCCVIAFTMIVELGSSINTSFILPTIKLFSFGFYGTQYKINDVDLSHTLSVLWTLPSEWRFYLFLPLAAVCLSNKRYTLILSLIAVVWSIGFLAYDNTVLYVYFLTGGFCALAKKHIIFKHTLIPQTVFYIAIVVNIYYLYQKIELYGYGRFLLSSLLFSSALFASPGLLKLRAFVYLGEISYSTYLTHLILFYLYGKLISSSFHFGDVSTLTVFGLLGLYCVVVVTISTLTFKYIEYPFIRKPSKKASCTPVNDKNEQVTV